MMTEIETIQNNASGNIVKLQKELLDNLPCGAALYEFDGRNITVIHINKSYWELVGRDSTPNNDTSVFVSIHPDDHDTVKQEMAAAIRQKRNAGANIRILCGGPVYKPFHIDAKITDEKNGKYLLYVAYTPLSDKTMSVQEMLPMALSTMMSSSEDLSYIKDKDQHYLCCSRSVAEFLGLDSARDIVGKTDFDLFDEQSATEFCTRSTNVFNSGKAYTGFTERLRKRDGAYLTVSTSMYPITNEEGSVAGIYGVSRDITAQRERDSQLKLLTNSIPGGIATFFCTKNKIKLEYFNDGLCSLYGYSREEFTEKVTSPTSLVYDEDKNNFEKQINNLLQNGKPLDCVVRIHINGGGFKWVSCKAVAYDRIDNALTVNCVLTDITEQQKEREQLRVSEEFNRLAMEQSGKIITRYDVRRHELTLPEKMNPLFELPHVLTGMPEEQITLGRVSPDTADIYLKLFNDIERGESSGTAVYKQISTEGWRWLEAQYTTVLSDTGEPVFAVISFTDITERLEKEVVYNKWQQSLKERKEDSYTLFRCNLSKNNTYDSREGNLIDISFEDKGDSFDQRTNEYVRKRVYADDRERYTAFLGSDTLLAAYYRGRRSGTLEYRETDGDGNIRWLSLTVDLVEYPGSRDVEAYLMYEDIDEQKKSELLAIERSETDPLTGIYNRAAFISRLEHILHTSDASQKHALMMLDIDNFKTVNDTYGHNEGDFVLRTLTGKINAILRHGDLCGRLGGDEFFVFLRDITGEKDAAAKAEQICALDIGDKEKKIPVTLSIGIAMVPRDGNDFDTLYKKADETLYRKKEMGKNGFMFA